MRRGSHAEPRVTLVAFDAAGDLPRLEAWLRRPHVVRWWGDPDEALEDVRQRSPDAHALIALDGAPVGYLCWERPTRDELEADGLGALPDNLLDVDVLIGEPEAMGRGIGPRAGQLLLERLRASGAAGWVGVGMSASNPRAIRAAEKLGFREAAAFDDPEAGPGCYYVLDLWAPAG